MEHGGLSQRQQYKRYCGRQERRQQPFCCLSVSVPQHRASAVPSALAAAARCSSASAVGLGLRLPGTRRWLARRRGPEGAAGADPEDGAPILFSTSKASPRVWSVSQSMGSDHERPWVKVLPLSLLCSGFLLWCVFREPTEIDEKNKPETPSPPPPTTNHNSNHGSSQ
uniref:Protein CCSMST1 n=1 Tax=Amazona collaria TaxID=241587 RepID=A0A8B9ITU8_9PSIT